MLRSLVGPFAFLMVFASAKVPAQSFVALPPDPETPGVTAHFGDAVAVSGHTIAVGSITDCCEAYFDRGAVEGSVFLYRYSNGAWVHHTTLSAPASNMYNGFGASVSVSGDFLVVGAPHQGVTGKAYVYRFSGTDWGPARELIPSDPAALYQYGANVAVVGDLAVVGTGLEEAGEFRLYLFRFNGRDWIEETVLGSAIYGEFAVLENMILLEQYDHISVLRRAGGSWVNAGELPGPAGSRPVSVGWAHVAAAGNLAVASFRELPQSRSPARVYRYDGDRWHEEAVLNDTVVDGATQEFHGGEAYATDGKRILIGAEGYSVDGQSRGKVYLYERRQAGWVLTSTYTAVDLDLYFGTPGIVGKLGKTVAVSGSVAVIGAFAAAFVLESPISEVADCAVSGSWYNPSEPGHGWVLQEATSAAGYGRFVGYYLGHANGQQVWLVGSGPGVIGNGAEIEMLRASGAGWGDDFDPNAVVMNLAGKMTFEFSDCDHGAVNFAPANTALDAFSREIVRMTRSISR